MKKILFTTLCVAALAGCAHQVQAKGPISDITVGLGTIGTAAGTWAALKFWFGVPFNSFTDKSSLIISTVALGAGVASWWGLSYFTASEYLSHAKWLVDGDGSAHEDVLLMLKETVATSPEDVATLTVDAFSVYENELARSVSALGAVHDEMISALSYLKAAHPYLNEFDVSQAGHYKAIALEVIGKVKAASSFIKSDEDYQRQYANEIEKQKVAAEREKAKALRYAATASSVQAHYVHTN